MKVGLYSLMPTTQKISVVKAKGRKVRVAVSFEFDRDDPKAADIYRGIAFCLREALTPNEVGEFLVNMEVERRKLAAK